jgi:hypothetical protein
LHHGARREPYDPIRDSYGHYGGAWRSADESIEWRSERANAYFVSREQGERRRAVSLVSEHSWAVGSLISRVVRPIFVPEITLILDIEVNRPCGMFRVVSGVEVSNLYPFK